MSTPPHKVVLVVDDESSILKLLTRRLEASGFIVITAADRSSAEATLTNFHVDAIIVDLRLGHHVSGLDLISLARSFDRLAGLPIMVLTGMTHLTSEEEDFIRHHGACVFYKPVPLEEIAATLDRLLRCQIPI